MKKTLTIFIAFIPVFMLSTSAGAFSKSFDDAIRIGEKYCIDESPNIKCSSNENSIGCITKSGIINSEMMIDLKNHCLLIAEENKTKENKTVSITIPDSIDKKNISVDKTEKTTSTELLNVKTEDKETTTEKNINSKESFGSGIKNIFKSDKKKLAEATGQATDSEKQALEEFNTSVQIAKSEFERKLGI